MKPTHLFAAFVAGTIAIAAFAIESSIAVRDEPPALVVTFSNLPESWTLEKTDNLTNWFSVLVAGDRPPRDLSLVITNRAQAAFYRISSTP